MIIASDFHGNLKKLDKFMNYKPDVQHVFAGDAVDSWNEPYECQLQVLKELVESNCILIYGNHELSYHSDYRMPCSGRHSFGETHFPYYINQPDRWRAAYNADGYLVTHAGLSNKYKGRARTIKTQVSKLNKQLEELQGTEALLAVGRSRGGRESSGGIFWYDFRYDWDKLVPINQVFGHCALQKPWQEKNGDLYHHVCINSDDREDECWVFDTGLKEVVVL